ncbi:MAG: hypothetical protein Q7T29_13730 [Gallionella sp.]|nr:hypothetical protein [Gallionella sp.]
MDIATTLSAISSAKEFASLIISRKIDSAVTEKAIELQNSIIGLQSAILGLQGENQTLAQENRSLKEAMERISNWERDATQFELTKIAEGVYVYEVKDKSAATTVPWLCVSCFESRKRGILQRIGQDYGGTQYRCSTCKAEIYDHEDCAPVRSF